ncbi:MAG: enoyl-CoA hydratase/isomerase family protein [Proteobacteria bacterium]|nr:enoyl-CoA hydratase/isomerase family protein [Pseudomonadota bacterium]MBU4470650.1 enoyl-CoA hydratase/isomerase family protein [Pseudomonadota bacterium]MCG2753374.1 enoyl-CoA hydratase/isomerase family protein [Desulfobacteraceae bacterium]
MDREDILFKTEDGVATITLNCPERKNAFSMEMIDQWAETLRQWRTDPRVKVIVLTGSGDAFCSGANLSTSGGAQPLEEQAFNHKSTLWDQIHRIPLTLEDIDKPVIAALNGVAVGAGLDMALMCDIRFAAESARFAEGYVNVGFVPGDGAAYYLPRLVGISKALELLWTGDFISASEAERIGMVNRVYPDDQLMEETYKFAQKLANGPPKVIQMIKRTTYQSARLDLRTALDLVSSHMGVIRSTKDSRDAMIASLTRRRKNKDSK